MGIKFALATMIVFLVSSDSFATLPEEEKDNEPATPAKTVEAIKLPGPEYSGLSVESAIKKRRSVRAYSDKPLTQAQLSQLLFAAQGITYSKKEIEKRSAPSAGATYPYEIYFAANNIEGLEKGIYHYLPKGHEVSLVKKGDFMQKLVAICANQEFIGTAACCFILSAVPKRTVSVYGDRGYIYIFMEAGHISQNIYLESASLDLGTVAIGAFNQDSMKELLGLQGEEESPIYVQPVGVIKE